METRLITQRFGEVIDLDVLLEFAEIDAEDLESAIQWWDENASEDWINALSSEPYNKRE